MTNEEKYIQALEVSQERFNKIEELQNRIDTAIEYINQHIVKDKSTKETIYIAMNIENVLNILKGEK